MKSKMDAIRWAFQNESYTWALEYGQGSRTAEYSALYVYKFTNNIDNCMWLKCLDVFTHPRRNINSGLPKLPKYILRVITL